VDTHRILIVDDDPNMLSMLRRTLGFEGYRVSLAADAETALRSADLELPNLVLVDVMLPDISGLELCRRLRARLPEELPMLMLTARGSVRDRVAGLDAGADDYLTKPFSVDELLARIRALLRRSGMKHFETLELAGLKLIPCTREVFLSGRTIDLTTREFDLLEMFIRHPRQVLTREVIFLHVWGYELLGSSSNTIDAHIKAIRAKLEARGEPRLLHTIRGVGYSLRET
jgi:two-component system response regulator MprA